MSNKQSSKSSVKQLLKFVDDKVEPRYNELTREIEIQGKPLEREPYILLASEYNLEIGKERAADILFDRAKTNKFNPVKQYLKSLPPAPHFSLDDLATRYLGADDALYDIFLKKTLIGAVARVFNPGCKLDTALVLQGSQGLLKSTFFKVLGGDWFDDSMGAVNDKDDLLTFHRCWIQEWGEIDRVFGKKAVGEIKQFLSKSADIFREPYARKPELYKRKTIIVGTVNEATFLNDPTGDRRFWVIPVKVPRINVERLAQERDLIWAAATKAFMNGETWWLDPLEQILSTENNKDFYNADEWEQLIEEWVKDQKRVTTKDIMTKALGFIGDKDLDRSSQMRVAACMRSLGWEKHRARVRGKQTYVWEREYNVLSFLDYDEVDSEVSTANNGSMNGMS